MSRKYKFQNPAAAYFVSFATVYWLDVFTRQAYFTILEQAVAHCRKEKGMVPIARDCLLFYAEPLPFSVQVGQRRPIRLVKGF